MLKKQIGNMREKLAELAHEQWSGWIKYMFGKCQKGKDGTLIIPKWAVERWEHQAHTSYSELSEGYKNSDRVETDKFLALFEANQ